MIKSFLLSSFPFPVNPHSHSCTCLHSNFHPIIPNLHSCLFIHIPTLAHWSSVPFPSTHLYYHTLLGRRLFEEDHPLTVILEGSVAGRNSKLVLRDNLCSTIQWDAFSLPELNNFITMLHREEKIYASRVSTSMVIICVCDNGSPLI